MKKPVYWEAFTYPTCHGKASALVNYLQGSIQLHLVLVGYNDWVATIEMKPDSVGNVPATFEKGKDAQLTPNLLIEHENHNDTAIVVGTDTARGTDNGTAYTVVYRYTVTYVRRQGQWVALAEHLVKAPQSK